MKNWHDRLGHPSVSTMKRMIRNHAISGIGIDLQDWSATSFECKDCNIGKLIRKPFHSKSSPHIMPNSCLHIDIKGPINPHLLSSRNESFAKILLTIQRLRTQYPQFPIQRIRLDNAAEFTSKLFQNHCQAQGIILEYSTPYEHEQNGLAESYVKRISHMARTMLLGCNLPKTMWQHAVNHAAYLSGFWAHSALKYLTPNELSTGTLPDVSHLRRFGCTVYTPMNSTQKTFTGPHRQLGIYIGCLGPSIIWWLHPQTGAVFKARFADCIFDEKNLPRHGTHRLCYP